MSALFRLPFLGLTAATLAAQTTPVTPPAHSHSHAPAAPTHAHGIVTLDEFVTSAAPFARNQVDLAQSTTVLSDRPLRLKQQATLGDTLAAETGMHATSFGPAASRPIIRGLGGDRIRLLENSIGVLDASVASPDHAVTVEPMLVERIEVVRGPASLLYGSSAVGGVVNVLTHRIETDLPAEPVRGAFEVRGNSAADEFSRGGVLDLALKPRPDRAVIFHFDASRRDAENLRIPGFVESDRLRAEETRHALDEGEPAPAFARGRLPNSSFTTRSGAAGVSFVTGTFHVGASYSGIDSDYGVPGHAHADEAAAAPTVFEGVRLDVRQRRTDVQAEWHGGGHLIQGARLKFGHGRYRHVEFEPDGESGTVFTNRGHDARLEVLHGDGKPWSGAIGAQSLVSKFAALGDEAFLPPSRTNSAALFAFEEITLAPLTWQFGARWERTKIATPDRRPRHEPELSGSAGLVWKLDEAHAASFSVAHTGRAPNVQELFADGPHAGTQSFEIGSAALHAERSLGVEASLRRKRGFVTGAATVFAHRFDGYIFQAPTGLVAVPGGADWEFRVPADERGDAAADALPVYRYVQRDARFWGAELETVWHLHEGDDSQLDLRLAADFTRARQPGENLPRIPARRVSLGAAWTKGHWSLGAESQFVLRQDHVAPGESATPGYALVSAQVTRELAWRHFETELFLRGSNLADAEARPHTSFVKDIAPLGGRAVVAGVRVSF